MNWPVWFWVYVAMLPTAWAYRLVIRRQREVRSRCDKFVDWWIWFWPCITITVIWFGYIMIGPVIGAIPFSWFANEHFAHLLLAAGGLGFFASCSFPFGRVPILIGLSIGTSLTGLCLLLPGYWKIVGVLGWYPPLLVGTIAGVARQRGIEGVRRRLLRRDITTSEGGLGTGAAGEMFEKSRIDRDQPGILGRGPEHAEEPPVTYDAPVTDSPREPGRSHD
ncbi:MAG: hypothetical protein R3B68_15770 [Phycisphaerales bacterium]